MIRNKTGFVLTAQEVANLMSVLTVTIWIRGEQLEHVGARIIVPGGAEIDTHDLHIPVCTAQRQFAQELWDRAYHLLKQAGKPTLPTWHELASGPPKT